MNIPQLDPSLDFAKTSLAFLANACLGALPRAFLFGLVGLVVAIVALKLVSRRGWLVRTSRLWNMAAKLHYPIWILLFTFTGCSIGATSATKSRTHEAIENTLGPVVTSQLPVLKAYLLQKLPVRSADTPISVGEATQRFLQTLYYEPKSDGVFEQTKARCINWVTLNFGKWVVVSAFGTIVAYAVGKGGDTLGLDSSTIEFTVNTIKKADLSQVDKNIGQIVVDAVQHQVETFFNGLYAATLKIFVVLLALLAIEIIAYRWWRSRQARQTQSV